MWDAGHSQHLYYSIPVVLDSIDLRIPIRTRIFIHILGYVAGGVSPPSLILLCTLLSLFYRSFVFTLPIFRYIFVYCVIIIVQ